jgi:hypothetical protein
MENLILTLKDQEKIKAAILTGLEVSSAASSKATYYHQADAQKSSVVNAVKSLYDTSKEIPLILACNQNATGFFIQEVIKNELKMTASRGACKIVNPLDWEDGGLGSRALNKALKQLESENGITYVLRLFSSFRDEKINNSRASKMILRFLLPHPNLEFIAIKYRSKVIAALRHAWGVKRTALILKILSDPGVFFGEKARRIFIRSIAAHCDITRVGPIVLHLFRKSHLSEPDPAAYPLLAEYHRAKTNVLDCSRIPEEVLFGLLTNPSHPQHQEMWGSKDRIAETKKVIREKTKASTANMQLRQTKENQSLGVTTKKTIVQGVTDFLALYKTGYETGFTPEIKSAIEKLAEKKRFKEFPYRNLGIVLDKSQSMTGNSAESKNTPRAIAHFTGKVLAASCDLALVEKTDGPASDLADAFIRLVERGQRMDAVFILSDGYENSYEGLLSEVVAAWRELAGEHVPVFHISPLVAAETGAKGRRLGDGISTCAITKPEGLLSQVNAKLLEQDIRRWIQGQVLLLEEETKQKEKKGQPS